ncbi:SemiSWEET transporter [Magnetospirillum sulfuroxidans]|uniref:SemiSWEET family sugar transporter n=1 Tax=Magnetospirillum sulfuroxidans TaxID=611300 RepID=A0ABS5IB66_9PROT|nr:SemiSWEET transporter [Magnetospirillum sulfuroxidans]MBR9971675.1 SemiSWEET family sugar transporter [Magnetospirillum sulfuroxidans]
MSALDVIGSIAGTLTTLAFVPQVVKTLRTRQTRDISTAMWLMFCAGVALWLVYGLLLAAWPIIVANALTLVLAGVVLGVKLANRRRDKAQVCGTRTSLNQ